MPCPIRDTSPGARADSRAFGARLVASRRHRQDGSVTAETVMVLPVLVAVTLGLAWLLALAATQIRVVDAARETARAVARDDDRSSAVALGRRVAPDGSRIVIHDADKAVAVRVTVDVRGPGGLFEFLPHAHVVAEAVAAKEPR